MKGSGDFSIGGRLWPGISKLMEECGEVLQVCGKLVGSCGVEEHWDGTNLRQRLEEEMGDLLAAIEFVTKYNSKLNRNAIEGRRRFKLALFEEWHSDSELWKDFIKPEPEPAPSTTYELRATDNTKEPNEP